MVIDREHCWAYLRFEESWSGNHTLMTDSLIVNLLKHYVTEFTAAGAL